MITVKFSIPELQGRFGLTTPKLYVWTAFFWGDIHSFATPNPVVVYTVPSTDTRDAYPDLDQALVAVPIPAGFGTEQINLDDAGQGLAAAGVLVLVLGQHDTPDDAIAAGYSAFGTAVSQQLNAYVANYGLVSPTPAQVSALASSIQGSVTSAISNNLSDWDKFLTWIGQETQDEFIGYSYAFFGPGQLTPPQQNAPLNLPPIFNQIEYTFPFATLNVQTLAGPDPCEALQVEVNQAMYNLTQLTNRLRQLQTEYAAANLAQKQVIKIEIKQIQTVQLPAATTALANAQRALYRCRFLHNLIPPGNGVATAKL